MNIDIVDLTNPDKLLMISPPSTPTIHVPTQTKKRARNKTSEKLYCYAEESRMPYDYFSENEEKFIKNKKKSTPNSECGEKYQLR